jgi:uncharacterized protein with FMN-binding domain
MKRAFLIIGGTLGGLGAVLAITPPQLGSSDSALTPMDSGLPVATATPTAAAGATAAPSASAATGSKPSATKPSATKPGATQGTKPATTQPATTQPATTKPAATKPAATKPAAPSTQGVSGTFTGDPVDISYGIVQVAITVVNGKITDAQAVRVPSARNDRYTNMSLPVLRQKTLAAQSSQITGVSGASYTSFGWFKSLQSALTKAGLPL